MMASVSTDRETSDRGVAGRGAWMVLGRIADQGALGLTGLILAARLSVADYAPVALILVAHSLAATLSDLGLAHEMLRLAPGESGNRRDLLMVRAVNIVCLAAAGALWLTDFTVPALTVGLWALSSETMLRQSATMLADGHRRLGLVQALAAVLLAVLVIAFGFGPEAVGLAIGARVLLELVLLSSPDRWFATGSSGRNDLAPIRVFVTHLIGYGNRNVDYLIGAPFLGSANFARYVFAYRLANAGFAPVGTIATRLGIAELAAEPGQLEPRYRRGMRVLFLGGLAAAVVTALGALAVPHIVGDRWSEAVPLILLLTVALPFRFIDGVISPLLYVSNRHQQAINLELIRLAVIAAAVVAGAWFGLRGLAIAMSASTIVTVWAGHRWAAAKAGIGTPRWLDRETVVALLVLAVAAAL